MFCKFLFGYSVQNLTADTGAISIKGYDKARLYHLRILKGTDILTAGEAYWIGVANERVWKGRN